MAVHKSRLIIWLIKAYVKRWGKVIGISFVVGLLIFFILISTASSLVRLVPVTKKDTIGIVGAYKLDNLPMVISQYLSRGLTQITSDGKIKPDIATSWEVKQNGKVYIFHLAKNLLFSNGDKVTSQGLTYNFQDVAIQRPDEYTIIFILKEAYAPFLVTVSKPVFEHGFIGVGKYTLSDVQLNGDFIKSLRISVTKNKFESKEYLFYPTLDALKIAFMLGEVRTAVGLADIEYRNTSLAKYPDINVKKSTNYRALVTLFYNTQDDLLSDKKIRDALSYSLPDTFSEGQREFLPYPATQWYYNHELDFRKQDFTHAKLLLDASTFASKSASMTIKTLTKYRAVAQKVADSWKNIGIKTSIETTDIVPKDYQVYLGDFTVPRDPDQYTLWHSDQENNITFYRNLRIDKLLEDGRKSIDSNERQKIYADFQKYLLDDSPASFLYFPYEYQITRK